MPSKCSILTLETSVMVLPEPARLSSIINDILVNLNLALVFFSSSLSLPRKLRAQPGLLLISAARSRLSLFSSTNFQPTKGKEDSQFLPLARLTLLPGNQRGFLFFCQRPFGFAFQRKRAREEPKTGTDTSAGRSPGLSLIFPLSTR